MRDERKDKHAAVVRFPRQSRYTGPAPTDSQGAPASQRRSGTPHETTRYMRWLRAERLLVGSQYRAVNDAISGLRRRFPNVSRQTVEAVRAEMLGNGPNKHQLAGIELAHWREALASGVCPIPRVEFDKLYRKFVVRPLQDREQTVVPIDGSSRGVLPEYVPHRLAMAECFFLIILKMFRKQHEHDVTHKEVVPVPGTVSTVLEPEHPVDHTVRSGFWRKFAFRLRWLFARNPWRDLADGNMD